MQHPTTKRISRAADALHYALNPTDEVRVREDIHQHIAETWPQVLRTLARAEDELDTGVGGPPPNLSEGFRLVRQARAELETSRSLMSVAPQDVGIAYADALRDLDAVLSA